MNKVRAMSYTTALQKTLRSHIKVQHDGLRYNCDLCSFSSTGQSSLRLHIRTKHEGVQYKCDSCGMNFAHKDNLRLHRKVVHEGKKIKCDLCDFQAAKRSRVEEKCKFSTPAPYSLASYSRKKLLKSGLEIRLARLKN